MIGMLIAMFSGITATARGLLPAADTAYNDFPRVMFLLARDRFAPRPFLRMGDRLAFNNGIVFVSIVATLVFVAFSGNASSLIPLRGRRVPCLYALSGGIVFTTIALLTRRHFNRVADAIALSVPDGRDGEADETPAAVSNLLIVPVAHLDRVTVRALAYAASLGPLVLALHVSPTEEESERFREYWGWHGVTTCHSSSSSPLTAP